MGADEEGTLERLKSLRRELLDPKIAEHKGRIVKTTGDGLLVEFASVVDAVRCAIQVQQAMPERNSGVDNRIELRIGINLGDVIVEGDDLYGDGVNTAARIEALADPGGVFVSNTVHDHVRDRLPFANMSGDPEQEYFVDGMVEEIITALSRIRWLFVIARNSTFTYKGQAIDVKRVGRELGVRYVLEGSVRKAGNRVRITGQLIDASTGAHLWADRFDGSLEDVFELQDKAAISVAGVIAPALQAAEIRRSADRPTNDLTAYDYYLRALAHWDARDRDQSALALARLDKAIDRDPSYAPALALAAHCRCQHILYGWTEDENAKRSTAIDLARRALQSADDDPDVLASAAYVLGAFSEDIGVASSLLAVDRSTQKSPQSHDRRWLCEWQSRI